MKKLIYILLCTIPLLSFSQNRADGWKKENKKVAFPDSVNFTNEVGLNGVYITDWTDIEGTTVDTMRIYDSLAQLQYKIDTLPHFNDLDTTLQSAKDYADNITVQIPTNTPRDSIPIYDSIAALRGDIGGGAMTTQAIIDSIATSDTVFIDTLKPNVIILGADTITAWENDCFSIALSDSLTEITTATGDSWDWIYNCSIDSIVIGVNKAPTGSALTVEIKKNSTSIFSTAITIDADETTSVTAATDYTLSTTDLDFGDDIQAYASSVGATYGGAGLKVYIYYKKDK